MSRQTLKKFTAEGLYHLGSHSAQMEATNKFKEDASQLHFYKDDTCWYVILLALNVVLPVAKLHHTLQAHNFCHGNRRSVEITCCCDVFTVWLKTMFFSLSSNLKLMFQSHSTSILCKGNGLENLFSHIYSDVICENVVHVPTSRSIVLLEESALKLREQHQKYSGNVEEFNFQCRRKVPPKHCPDLECTQYTDSEESDFEEESRSISEAEKIGTGPRSKEEDNGNGSDIFYGHGLESCNKDIQITAKLNFSKIYNILWLLPYFYPGFHSSYLYFGTKHSMFPVHIEDGLSWSLNFLFMGLPKIWQVKYWSRIWMGMVLLKGFKFNKEINYFCYIHISYEFNLCS